MHCYRLALLFSFASLAGAAASEDFDVAAHYTKIERNIAMRDGVKLFTVIYSPKDSGQDYPILLTRTPYSVEPYGPVQYKKHLGPPGFAPEKFIFVYQDARGRFMSEGEFVDVRPIKEVLRDSKDTDESTDTYDTIEWLVKNVPKNNGKVGMMGTSYPGFYTSSGIIRAHPALVAASPQAPMADLYKGDDAFHNGAFFLIANFSFYTGFNVQKNPQAPPKDDAAFDYGTKDGYQYYLKMGSLANSESLLPKKNPYWTDMYIHATYDDFWKPRNILPHLRSIAPAVLVVGGWFDAEDLSGALKTFRAIGQQSPETTNSLVMGPWSHGAWNDEQADKLGDFTFGHNVNGLFQETELAFFRHYLKGANTEATPKALVFLTGKNEWKKLPQWPPTGTQRRLYFHADGKLTFDPPGENSAEDEYVSDPGDPVPSFPQPTLDMDKSYMDGDQRFVENREDVLTYVTDPLTEDVTIAGPIVPTIAVSTSATDSDFDVKLIDVYPADAGGNLAEYEQLVRGEPFRGKFRNSFEKPEPFEPGVVQKIHFDMPDVYHCFLKGHRIMVQVQSSWFPLSDRNPQTYTDIPHAKPDQFVKATETIHRSREFPSFVEVNVESQ